MSYPRETETMALLDAVMNANNELAEIGVGEFLAVIIRREPEAGLCWLGAVVSGAGITLHEAVGATPERAGKNAVDWVCLDFIPRPRRAAMGGPNDLRITPLGLPSECYSIEPRLKK